MTTLPTWDLFITLFFIMSLGYGLILGRQKIVVAFISCYIGYAISMVVGESIYNVLTGGSLISEIWVKSNISAFGVKSLLFFIIAVVVSLKGEIGVIPGRFAEGGKGAIFTAIYSFLTAGLIIASLISFLNPAEQQLFLQQSHLAQQIVNYYNLWFLGPVILMVSIGLIKDGS
jgi:hypothetical protein